MRLTRDRPGDLPDLVRVVLDPAGAGEVLLELAVGAARRPPRLVEDDGGGPGGALVDREDHRRDPTSNALRPPSRTAIVPRPREADQEDERVPDVEAHITGTVWKIECQLGQQIQEGDTLVVLESMKMEMPVEAEDDGVVKEIACTEGQSVSEGDTLVVLE